MARTARALGGFHTGVAAVAAVFLAGCAVAGSRDLTPPVHALRVGARMVALSFDDGPDPRWTPRVLALLRRYRARATFFVTGRNAVAYPSLMRDEVAAGDEVGDHTYTHPYLTRLSAAAVQQQIVEAAAAIQRVGAPRPTLFRPPYGLLDGTIDQAAHADRMRLILWSVCVERYVDHGPSQPEVARLLSTIHPGSIILAHDGGVPDRRRTLTALPLLLGGLEQRGYQIVTVGRLLVQSGLTRLSSRSPRSEPDPMHPSARLRAVPSPGWTGTRRTASPRYGQDHADEHRPMVVQVTNLFPHL